jgi:hypothetical protein
MAEIIYRVWNGVVNACCDTYVETLTLTTFRPTARMPDIGRGGDCRNVNKIFSKIRILGFVGFAHRSKF